MKDDLSMNIWWCNQKQGWEAEYDSSVVCSSANTTHLKYRLTVGLVAAGDIILHNVGPHGIVAISQARANAVECKADDSRKICIYGKGWAFPTRYEKFDRPIPFAILKDALFELDIEGGPVIAKKLGRQSYFLPFSMMGLRIVYQLAADRNWPDYITKALDVTSATDQSVPASTTRGQEGLLTELRVLARSRNRKLRDEAFEQGKGICAVCHRDFNKYLDGAGVRALHVHHLQQLSAYDEPRETRLEDLAVVCANCHALIHLDPKRALKIERLRTLLQDQNYLHG